MTLLPGTTGTRRIGGDAVGENIFQLGGLGCAQLVSNYVWLPDMPSGWRRPGDHRHGAAGNADQPAAVVGDPVPKPGPTAEGPIGLDERLLHHVLPSEPAPRSTAVRSAIGACRRTSSPYASRSPERTRTTSAQSSVPISAPFQLFLPGVYTGARQSVPRSYYDEVSHTPKRTSSMLTQVSWPPSGSARSCPAPPWRWSALSVPPR
jgi:hypothetical protein